MDPINFVSVCLDYGHESDSYKPIIFIQTCQQQKNNKHTHFIFTNPKNIIAVINCKLAKTPIFIKLVIFRCTYYIVPTIYQQDCNEVWNT